MPGPAYPAARAVALKVHAHFACHLAEAAREGRDDLAPQPDVEAIQTITDAAFWASLRREEGYSPKISLAFVAPDQVPRPLLFERFLPLAPEALAKLAPAVERPGIHLGVWRYDGHLCVWGTTRAIPAFCFVLEVISQGLLVVKHRRDEELSKFVNVAVLEGDQIKVLSHSSASVPGCPELVNSLLGFEAPSQSVDSVDVFTSLAVSMRAHGRGGSLLVVPSDTDDWRSSIVWPTLYAVSPPFTVLAELMRADEGARQVRKWQDGLRKAVESIAGLTAVDGATVITDDYNVLAFGAKIRRRDGSPVVDNVLLTEPVEGASPIITQPSQLGGTRHMSAAQFVHDQRDSHALVASQDGRFTIFAWSECDEMVRAHRLESLLL